MIKMFVLNVKVWCTHQWNYNNKSELKSEVFMQISPEDMFVAVIYN